MGVIPSPPCLQSRALRSGTGSAVTFMSDIGMHRVTFFMGKYKAVGLSPASAVELWTNNFLATPFRPR